jgi:hypothetical protein
MDHSRNVLRFLPLTSPGHDLTSSGHDLFLVLDTWHMLKENNKLGYITHTHQDDVEGAANRASSK